MIHFLKVLFLTSAGFFVSTAHAQQTLAAEKSELRFSGKQMNVAQDGKFKKFTAKLNLDAKKPDATRAELVIDINSIDLGSDEANEEVKRPSWFDVATHPQAKFVSTSVKAGAGGKFEMRGKLTIKGITKDVVVPFTMKEVSGIITAEGAIELKRLDFKVGDGVWADLETVANEVKIQFKLAATGAPAK